jgi:hypothetical protein
MSRPRRTKNLQANKIYRLNLVCEEKRFFKTEAEALDAADVRMLENMRLTIGVYQCPTCRQWHLTSLEPSQPVQ